MAELHYSMLIQWSDENDAYIVTIPEIPGCMTHGNAYEEALRQGKDAIETWVEVSRRIGRPIPEPKIYDAA